MPITINGTTGIGGVDGSAGTPAYQGTDTNTGISFDTDVVIASTGGTERARVDSAGRLLVGTSASRSNWYNITGLDNNLQIEGTTHGGSGLSLVRNQSSSPAHIEFGASGGTALGSYTLVSNNGGLGAISFQGADGTEFVGAASIEAFVDGTPGANDMPGRLVFSTTADGASSPTERMRITSNGDFLFQGDSTVTSATGFLRSPGETGNTLVKKFIIGEFGKSSISYPGQWSFHTSSGWAGSVFKQGFRLHLRNYDVGSATESADLFRFDGNGGLANFSAFDTNLSDINAKKDVTSAASTWDCLKQWEIVNYRYKTQEDTDCINIGVIAQQVSESCPEVVTVFQAAQEETDSQPALEELLGIKEQQMYWMAIKALQEAMERIEQLEARITTLEAQP